MPETRPTFTLTRRGFLRWTLIGAGAALSARVFWPRLSGFETPSGLRFLTGGEAGVLGAVYSVMMDVTENSTITRAVGRMDAFLGNLTRADRLELRAALQLVEHTPLVRHGYFSRFTGLDVAAQRRCIEAWRDGGALLHPLFAGLKELSALAHYTDPAHWPEIGYDGPMVPLPADEPVMDGKYASLLAPRSGR